MILVVLIVATMFIASYTQQTFSAVDWAKEAPVDYLIKNIRSFISNMGPWVFKPFTVLSCGIMHLINPAAACIWWLGFFPLFLWIIAGIWGSSHKVEHLSTIMVISLAVIMILGYALVMLGIIK